MNRFATPLLATLLLATLVVGAPAARAQAPTTMRTDAVWARATTETITLDGNLTEASWAQAESLNFTYGQRTGNPGSGFKDEGNANAPRDPMRANVKFLVNGDQLYVAATVQDASIGGTEFNRFDGLLMKFRDATTRDATIGDAPVLEYFYAWMAREGVTMPGDVPQFMGPFGDRTNPSNVARWDAATSVVGTSNDDAGAPDTRYTMEMRFDLAVLGYSATQGVRQIGYTFSIYDVDGFFPFSDATFSSNRTWWQSGFGGGPNVGRVFASPSVTVTSGAVPGMPYDAVIGEGSGFAAPTVDGVLNEAIWTNIQGFDIRFNDPALRLTYPGMGALTSGQFQPDVDGDGSNPLPTVVDPANATVKWFHRGDRLYVGVNVRDAALSARDGAGSDFWDGFRLSLNDRVMLEPNDNYLLPYAFDLHLNAAGALVPEGALASLMMTNPGAVSFATRVSGTIGNPSDSDTGYQIEMSLDLTAIGYPAGLGDGVLFAGANVFDFDALDDPTASYGSRAWYFREAGPDRAAAYAYLSSARITAGEAGPDDLGSGIRLIGAQPNPAHGATTLRYELPEAGTATVEVYDQLGRLVATVDAGRQAAGVNAAETTLDLPSGIYLYRVRLDVGAGSRVSPAGRFTVVR